MLKLQKIILLLILLFVPLQMQASSNMAPIISYLLSDAEELSFKDTVKGKTFYTNIGNENFTMKSWTFSEDGLSCTWVEVEGGTANSNTVTLQYNDMVMTMEDGVVMTLVRNFGDVLDTDPDDLYVAEIMINNGTKERIYSDISWARMYFRVESSSAYYWDLSSAIHSNTAYFGWTINSRIDGLQNSITIAKERIRQGEIDLEDEDIDPSIRAKFDTFIGYIDDLTPLVNSLNDKNTQLDLAIRSGMSVSHINNLANEIRDMVYHTPMYDFFDEIAVYANTGNLPVFYTDENGDDQYDYVNIYINEAAESSWTIRNTFLDIDIKMRSIILNYTTKLQENIFHAVERGD